MKNQNNTLNTNLVYNIKSNIGIGTPVGLNPASKLIINVNERIMKYKELEALVISWAEQKGILENGTTMKQAEKTHEEVLELISAIDEDNRDEITDALGDILVTIIIQAEMQGLKLEECLQSAYNVISKRSGVMRNGQFHKD